MKKKITIIILFLLLGLVVVYVLNSRYLLLEKFMASNYESGKIELKVSNRELDKSSVSIFQKNNGYLFKNGLNIDDYLSLYGWSCFTFEYNDVKVCEVCYFKKNSKNVNDHYFSIGKKDDNLDLSLKLKGADSISKMYYKFYKKNGSIILDKNKNPINSEFINPFGNGSE